MFRDTLPAYREFTDGRVYSRLPIVVLRGVYSVAGSSLTVTMFGQPPDEYPFRLEGGLLKIRHPNGTEKDYRRPETSLLRGY